MRIWTRTNRKIGRWALVAMSLLGLAQPSAAQGVKNGNSKSFTVDMCFVLPRLDAMGNPLLGPGDPKFMGYAVNRGVTYAITAGLVYPKGTLAAWAGLSTDYLHCPDDQLAIGVVHNTSQAVYSARGTGTISGQISLFFNFMGGFTDAARTAYGGPLGVVTVTNFGVLNVTSGSVDFSNEGTAELAPIDSTSLRSEITLPLRPGSYSKGN